MRAIVIRHYKTLIDVANQIMGWGDAPPADDWEPDVAYVDAKLRQAKIDFDAVHTSSLERSFKTGIYFASTRGINEVHDHQELREVNYGVFYNKSKKWVQANIPEFKTDPDYVFADGESFRQMQRRSVGCFSALAKRHRDETILVVTHAGVIRGLVCHFLRLGYAENLRRKISHRYIGEFCFQRDGIRQYSELGEPSGFVRGGIVEIPCHRLPAGTPTPAG